MILSKTHFFNITSRESCRLFFHHFKRGVLSLLLLTIILIVTASPASAQTFDWTGVCVGEGPNIDVATIQGAECLIANVFIVIITIIGLIGFVMFIIGAIKWMMAGSNTQGVQKARSTMLYSVVGLVVALSAFIIINLIADFTGVNVIRYFEIPTSTRGIPSQANCSQQHPGSNCIPVGSCMPGVRPPNYINHGPICGDPSFVCCGPP